jgi:hypothetical protein
VETIGAEAFADCISLEQITVLNPEPRHVVHLCASKAMDTGRLTILVPSESVYAYRHTHGWHKFGSIRPCPSAG